MLAERFFVKYLSSFDEILINSNSIWKVSPSIVLCAKDIDTSIK